MKRYRLAALLLAVLVLAGGAYAYLQGWFTPSAPQPVITAPAGRPTATPGAPATPGTQATPGTPGTPSPGAAPGTAAVPRAPVTQGAKTPAVNPVPGKAPAPSTTGTPGSPKGTSPTAMSGAGSAKGAPGETKSAAGGGRPDPFIPLVGLGAPGGGPGTGPGGLPLPPVPSLPTPPPPPPPPPVQLLGILGNPSDVMALAIVADDKGSYIVGPGDEIRPGVKIVRIDVARRAAAVNQNGVVTELTLTQPNKLLSGPGGGAPGSLPASPGVGLPLPPGGAPPAPGGLPLPPGVGKP